MTEKHPSTTPVFIRLLKLLMASPEVVKQEIRSIKQAYGQQYCNTKTELEINDVLTGKIISVFSTGAAVVGGASALPGTIPGAGTMISLGTGVLDANLCKKVHRNLVTAIATVYGVNVNISNNESLEIYLEKLHKTTGYVVTGGSYWGSLAVTSLTHKYLKGARLKTITGICKKANIRFTRKAFVQKIPLGVGAAISTVSNKVITRHLGYRAAKLIRILYLNSGNAPKA
jgi:hypothetical protein